MTADERKTGGLTRGRLATEALQLVQADGLGALTMRALAQRLDVKAASLYWHVRDRDELLELLAQVVLAETHLPRASGSWRADARAVCSTLEGVARRRRDGARILLEAPEVLERSEAHGRLRSVLESTGLSPPQAREAASMMLVHVLVSALGEAGPATPRGTVKPALLSIDTGSHGVVVRAGLAMAGPIRVAHDPSAAAPAVLRGDNVIVRRRRGAGKGELELNPEQPWRFKIQAPTWHTLLDLRGLDVRGIHIDSGASGVECILPRPRGAIPIDVSGGVIGVKLRRPPGVKVVADISPAAVRLRLDAFSLAATASDVHWESAGPPTGDYYGLKINGGAVRVSLEEDATITGSAVDASGASRAGDADALELVLDGIASRQRLDPH
jgi:AcrR family transcriptional regulator